MEKFLKNKHYASFLNKALKNNQFIFMTNSSLVKTDMWNDEGEMDWLLKFNQVIFFSPRDIMENPRNRVLFRIPGENLKNVSYIEIKSNGKRIGIFDLRPELNDEAWSLYNTEQIDYSGMKKVDEVELINFLKINSQKNVLIGKTRKIKI